MVRIENLTNASVDDVIDLYNRWGAANRYSGRLDRDVWTQIIAAKPYFTPEEVLIAYDGNAPLGYVHLCHGPNTERTAPDSRRGSIEALFFDPKRSDAGAALVATAIDYHREHGARQIQAFSTFCDYPLYRGIYVGLEPLALEHDASQSIAALIDAGFEYSQHSVIMAGTYNAPVEPQPSTLAVDWETAPWTPPTEWTAATWHGLAPYCSAATIDGTEVGTCTYALTPLISEAYGTGVGGIAQLVTYDAYRRKGIGGYLVARAINHMFELGARRVTLGTQHDNWAAHATYGRYGMQIEDHIRALTLDLTPHLASTDE